MRISAAKISTSLSISSRRCSERLAWRDSHSESKKPSSGWLFCYQVNGLVMVVVAAFKLLTVCRVEARATMLNKALGDHLGDKRV